MPTLEFKGKQHIYAHHLTVPYRPLVPDAGRSLNPADTDDNLIIHGDNLHALKALLPRYAGKVKCIYIDPPYNTGKEGWVYNDNVNSPLMRQWLANHSPVEGEDLERHDKWLCMMWPRLHLLKELLAATGVIFVTIDDNEQHHLRMLMDEIFGENNFTASIIWHHRKSSQNDIDVSLSHNYILCYALDRSSFSFNAGDVDESRFSNPDQDPRGPWVADPMDAPNIRENLTYEIINPATGAAHSPPVGRCWRFLRERFEDALNDNRIVFGKSGKARPQYKRFLSEARERGTNISTIWRDDVGTATDATKELQQMFGRGQSFPTPKPTDLLSKIVRIATDENDIVLDSFAGSGTTAQAVLAVNQEDGSNRKFILVECEDYADTITAERVRRVINGVPNARDPALQEGLGGSFTYCTLGDPSDVERMLTGESLLEYSELAAYLLHTASGLSASGGLDAQNEDGLFYRNGDTDYYLLYRPEIDWLRSKEAVLNEQQARRIHASGRKAVVFAADKYMSQRFLTDMSITFCQIPYELHRSGLGGV